MNYGPVAQFGQSTSLITERLLGSIPTRTKENYMVKIRPPKPPTPPPRRRVKDPEPMILVAVILLGWCALLLVQCGIGLWRTFNG